MDDKNDVADFVADLSGDAVEDEMESGKPARSIPLQLAGFAVLMGIILAAVFLLF